MIDYKMLAVAFVLVFSGVCVYAKDTVSEILEDFDPVGLDEAQAVKISEALREAGFRPGPELDRMIRGEGFDPELIARPAPPGDPAGDRVVSRS